MAPSPICVPWNFVDTFSFHAAPNCCCCPAAAGKCLVCSRPEHLSAVMPCDEPRQGCNIARSRDNVANINIRTQISTIFYWKILYFRTWGIRLVFLVLVPMKADGIPVPRFTAAGVTQWTGHAHKFHQTFLQRNKKGSFTLQSGPGSVRPPLTASPCRTIIL